MEEIVKNISYWARYEVEADKDKVHTGTIRITDLNIAHQLNNQGYAICFTANSFFGTERKKENIKEIRTCFCDIDNHDGKYPLEKQKQRIKQCPLLPTCVVSTKSGYHCLWGLREPISLEDFSKIEKGLCAYFGADIQATDPLRLLRAPGFYHTKDPNNKHLCEIVERNGNLYSVGQMLRTYGNLVKPEPKYTPRQTITFGEDKRFLDDSFLESKYKLSSLGEGCGRNPTLTSIAYHVHQPTGLGLSGGRLLEYMLHVNSLLNKPLPRNEILAMIRNY